MKKLLILSAAFLLSMAAYAQSQKVVIDAYGNVVGTYVRTNANSYTVSGQDDFSVPKKGHTVVTYSADNGQGVLTLRNPGAVNVRQAPSMNAAIIGRLIYEEGDMPDCYQCLGKQDGWYRIGIGSNIGYVRADLLEWAPVCY